MGSKAWWKKVDALSNRKERSNPSFDEDSVRELNHYFANLCHDEAYIRPVPMDITENIPAPKLTLSQVSYALLKTKQTSTSPDYEFGRITLPYWQYLQHKQSGTYPCQIKGRPVHGSEVMSIRYPK